jgi:hypothetical protein
MSAPSLGVALLQWIAMAIVVAALMFGARRQSSRWRVAAFAVGGVLAILLIAELGARLLAFASPKVEGAQTYRSEIWRRRYVRLNSRGFRDSERGGRVSDSDHLLAVIGDSYAFGWGLRDVNDRLGEQLISELQAARGQRWWSMNASATDGNSLQQNLLMDSALVFRPDVVLLVYAFDDMFPQPVGPFAPMPVRVMFLTSYLFQELWARHHRESIDNIVGTDISNDDALVARHLEDVRRLIAKARGIARVALVVPFDISVRARTDRRDRYDRFVCAAARAGLPVVSVRDALEGHDFASLRVNDLDAHPNELANRLVAAKLAPIVREAMSTGRVGKAACTSH